MVIILVFYMLSALEVNVGPVLAVVGAAGFVIAFALQNSLSNVASGILMLMYRPFDINDFVKVAGVLGKVESMNLLSTQLRTPDNQLLVIPNNSVWGDVITNVTGITQRRVDLVFGIGCGDDIDKAQAILEEIVAAHELALEEPNSQTRRSTSFAVDGSSPRITGTCTGTSPGRSSVASTRKACRSRFRSETCTFIRRHRLRHNSERHRDSPLACNLLSRNFASNRV